MKHHDQTRITPIPHPNQILIMNDYNNDNETSILQILQSTITEGGSGVIGGQAFYDTNNDGMRDGNSPTGNNNNNINNNNNNNNNNVGVGNINVWLFSCNPTKSLAYQRTSSNGIYRFVNLEKGSYYIIAQPPMGYQFSDANGNPSISVVDDVDVVVLVESTINSESGRTICFELEEGEKTMDWSFGLYKPSDRPSPSPSATMTTSPSAPPSRSKSPSMELSSNPSMMPSHVPSRGATLAPSLNNLTSITISSTPATTQSMTSTSTLSVSSPTAPSLTPSSHPSMSPIATTTTTTLATATIATTENPSAGYPTPSRPTILEYSSIPTNSPTGTSSTSPSGRPRPKNSTPTNPITPTPMTSNPTEVFPPTVTIPVPATMISPTFTPTIIMNDPTIASIPPKASITNNNFPPPSAEPSISIDYSQTYYTYYPTAIPTKPWDLSIIDDNNNSNNNNNNDNDENGKTINTGTIIGIVACLVIALVICVIFAALVRRRKIRSDNEGASNEAHWAWERRRRDNAINGTLQNESTGSFGSDGKSDSMYESDGRSDSMFASSSTCDLVEAWYENKPCHTERPSSTTSLFSQFAMEFDPREEDNVDSNDDSEDEEAPPLCTLYTAVQKHSKNDTQQCFNVDTLPRINNSNHDEVPRTRSWSQYDLLEDISSESESIRLDKSTSSSPEKSYSVAPTALSPASSHFAAEADIESIRSLETEYHSLMRAIQSHPRHSPIWQKLNSYLERAREELHAITEDIEVHPHTIHIMAPSCNLGLVVDKPPDGGPVYIRRLHPLSPLRDQVQLKDKIIAIDGEDVRQSSPVEVGELLSGITTKEVRKITIVRHTVLVGYGGGSNYAGDRSSPTRSGVGLNTQHSNKSFISALTEDSPQHEANRFTYQSSANAIEARTIDNTTTIRTSKSEDPNERAVKLELDIKHFIRKLDDEMAQASLTDGKVSYGPMVQAKVNPHRMISVKSSHDKSQGGSTKDSWCSIERERSAVRETFSGRVKELDKGNKGTVTVPMRARSEEVKKDKSRYAELRRVNSDQSTIIKEEIKAAQEISAHIEELD